MEILPHREPMLLADEVSYEGSRGRGIYRVRGDEFFLRGHFPGTPVVPGVILCEIAAQICGVSLESELATGKKLPFFTSIDGVKFRSPVLPGDVLSVEFELISKKPPFFFFEVMGSVDGKRAVSGKLSFALKAESGG